MYQNLKNEINQYIKTNGARSITGALLNGVLNDMVDALGAVGGYGGIITPTSAAPQSDGNVFFVSNTAGTYTNFSNIVVNENELAFIYRSGSGWAKDGITLSAGGTNVVANPAGEATETMQTIKIGETIYTAPQGPQGEQGPAGPQGETGATGPQGEQGIQGDPGQNAVNPFKGWWPDFATLKAAHTATEGDSAYVKDASPATTWSIYVYDSTASSDNYWADSGLDADTSNVQTFQTGEQVNQVGIDSIPTTNSNNLVTSGGVKAMSLTYAAKSLILSILRRAVYVSNDVETDIDALEYEFEQGIIVTSITATFTQGTNVIYDSDTLDSLKQYLVVTANYSNGASLIISDSVYILSGTLSAGTSTITATYSEKSDDFSVVVTPHPQVTVTFAAAEMLNRAGLSNDYSNTAEGYHYVAMNSARAAYPLFDKEIIGGRTYIVSLNSNYSDVYISLNFYTDSALAKIAANQNLIAGVSIDVDFTPWLDCNNGDVEITVPEYTTSDVLSRVAVIRYSLKYGSAGTATIPNDLTAEITITEKTE